MSSPPPRIGICSMCKDQHGFCEGGWQTRCPRKECGANLILARSPPSGTKYVYNECIKAVVVCGKKELLLHCEKCPAPHLILSRRTKMYGVEMKMSQNILLHISLLHQGQQKLVDMKKEIGALRQQLAQTKKNAVSTDDVKRLKEEIMSCYVEYLRLDEEKNELQKTLKELGNSKGNDALEKKNEELKQIADAIKDALENSEEDKKRLKESEEFLRGALAMAEKKTEAVEADNARLREQVDSLQKQMEFLETAVGDPEFQRLRDKVDLLESENKSMKKKLEFNQKYLTADMKKFKEEAESLKKMLGNTQDEKENLQRELETRSQRMVEMEKGLNEAIKKFEETKEALQREMKTQIKKLEDHYDRLKKECFQAKEKYEKAHNMLREELRTKKVSAVSRRPAMVSEESQTDKPGPTELEKTQGDKITQLEDLNREYKKKEDRFNEKSEALVAEIARLQKLLDDTNWLKDQVIHRQKEELEDLREELKITKENLKELQEIQKKKKVYFDERDELRKQLEEKEKTLEELNGADDLRKEKQELEARVSQMEVEKQRLTSRMELELAERDRLHAEEVGKILAANTIRIGTIESQNALRVQEEVGRANEYKREVRKLREDVNNLLKDKDRLTRRAERFEGEARSLTERFVKKEPTTPQSSAPQPQSRIPLDGRKRTANIDSDLAPPPKQKYIFAGSVNPSCSAPPPVPPHAPRAVPPAAPPQVLLPRQRL